MSSASGEWEAETGPVKGNFRVMDADTFYEPVGGLVDVLLA